MVKVGADHIAHCLATIVSMSGGEIAIPANERALIEGKSLEFSYNNDTGTVIVRLAPQSDPQGDRFDV